LNSNAEFYAKHGGVHFKQNVDAAQINEFVDRLPEHLKQSMYQVCSELDKAGLNQLVGDEQWSDGNGRIGGSRTCGEE